MIQKLRASSVELEYMRVFDPLDNICVEICRENVIQNVIQLDGAWVCGRAGFNAFLFTGQHMKWKGRTNYLKSA